MTPLQNRGRAFTSIDLSRGAPVRVEVEPGFRCAAHGACRSGSLRLEKTGRAARDTRHLCTPTPTRSPIPGGARRVDDPSLGAVVRAPLMQEASRSRSRGSAEVSLPAPRRTGSASTRPFSRTISEKRRSCSVSFSGDHPRRRFGRARAWGDGLRSGPGDGRHVPLSLPARFRRGVRRAGPWPAGRRPAVHASDDHQRRRSRWHGARSRVRPAVVALARWIRSAHRSCSPERSKDGASR